MKSESRNIKSGAWRVVPQNQDDLWLLGTILEQGDRCTMLTTRKIQIGESESERKTMVLLLQVEKASFEGSALRILGVVREGTDDVPSGEHHSFLLGIGESITIQKEWGVDQVQRVREACERAPATILIVVFDREEGNIALLRRNGYQLLAHLTGAVQRKRMQEKVVGNFFVQLAASIKDYDERFKPNSIVLASPAFWKEEFLPHLDQTLQKKVVLATSSGGHEQAINEVLRRDEVRSALAQDRMVQESRRVEEVLAGIAKGSAIAYGLTDVQKAADAGAVATLLVSDTRIAKAREDAAFAPIDSLMRTVDAAKGEVVIVGSHEGGKKLDGLGGIAAILRYRL